MVLISMIAAIGENRELGKDNKLLWDIPEDMKRFRELTKGHVVIMGRKTYESIGHPLPKRINIIVTRDKKKFLSSHPELDSGSDSGQVFRQAQDTEQSRSARMTTGFVCQSLEEAIELAKSLTTHYSLPTTNDEIFIIGGGQIYEQGIKYADKLYLTIVKGKFDADTYFPNYSEFKKTVFRKESNDEDFQYDFLELKK